jgi:hypothetical protein
MAIKLIDRSRVLTRPSGINEAELAFRSHPLAPPP